MSNPTWLLPPTPPPAPATPEERARGAALLAAAEEAEAARKAAVERGPLYQVNDTSHSLHDCCFQATVIRTDQAAHSADWSVCETHDVETAQRIADALNAQVSRETSAPV